MLFQINQTISFLKRANNKLDKKLLNEKEIQELESIKNDLLDAQKSLIETICTLQNKDYDILATNKYLIIIHATFIDFFSYIKELKEFLQKIDKKMNKIITEKKQ